MINARKKLFKINDQGSIAIEFAFIAPALVLIVTAIAELALFILLQVKLATVAGTISNNITLQKTVSSADITAMFGSAKSIVYPFDFTTNGNIVVSQVQPSAQNVNIDIISWQVTSGPVSKLGTTNGVASNLPNNITLTAGQSIIVTEVFYNYKPVLGLLTTAKDLYFTSTFVPRQGTLSALS